MQFRDFDVQRVHVQDLQRQAHHLNGKGHFWDTVQPQQAQTFQGWMPQLQWVTSSILWARVIATGGGLQKNRA